MANINGWFAPGKRRFRRIYGSAPRYVTYQALSNDPGNWSSGHAGQGTLIGTNRSIAAPTLIAWRNRMVTPAEMMALTDTEAKAIYKDKYWDEIQGDQISSQVVAEMMADMKSSAGGNGIKAMQRALNGLGEQITVDGNFGASSLQALNRQLSKSEKVVYQAYHRQMTAFYQAANPDFRTQWLEDLNQDYPFDNPLVSGKAPTSTKSKTIVNVIIITLIIIILVIIFYTLYSFYNE